MKSIAALALLFAAAAATSAQSQEVYRCGNSYSQRPCAGGASVQVDDARSATQSRSSIDQTQRDLKTADEMQKARLREEAKAAPAVIGASPMQPEERAAKRASVNKPDFTAVEPRKKKQPAEKKKSGGGKKATKKSAAKEKNG